MLNNVVSWAVDPTSTNISSFNVYRSIVGTNTTTEPFNVQNMYLKMQTGAEAGKNPTVVMVQSNDPVAIAAQLNSSVPGLLVDVNGISPNRFLTFRGTKGFLEIFQTVGASDLGLVPGNYVPQQNWLLVGNIPWDPLNL